MGILEKVNSSDDIKKLNINEKRVLCGEIREFLVDNISKTGGHLASNLGVVELTVAMHSVFDIPGDKFVWDVGHQSYVNKIITGRKDRFDTLRCFGGISGFPKTSESDADVFNTGHSSTSISAALGIARARDLSGMNYSVGAVFGDGALTGGMMYEAMNDAGRMKTPFILILNDNNMSISKNVGSVSKYLRALRIKPGYSKAKGNVEVFLDKIPGIGVLLRKFIQKIKRYVRRMVLANNIFEDFGFEYLGPVDGHDLEKLTDVLKIAQKKYRPVFIHVLTKKGKGYPPAEYYPEEFHGVGCFDKKTGMIGECRPDYSKVFGEALFETAKENDKVVGITGAMPVSTGMSEFSKYFRDRFFDVGIAEQHGVTMAAGLSISGYIPVIPIYSSFLQRAYDQILHDVCLQKLHVVFPVDRAGIVGSDGETHQGIYDIAFLSSMPGMAILSPSSFDELRQMLNYAVNEHDGPVAIRYPRGNTQIQTKAEFVFGKSHVIEEGTDITVYATGRMLKTAYEIREKLGDKVKIVAVPTIRPIDIETIADNASEISVVLEDGIVSGGLGSSIAKIFSERNINSNLILCGYPDKPIEHGTVQELDRKYGMDSDSVLNRIKSLKG